MIVWLLNHLLQKKETESGIIIPENSQKKPNLAQVLEVGPDCKSGIKVGDYIVTPKSFQATTDIEVNEDMVSVIKEENVVAIVNIENK